MVSTNAILEGRTTRSSGDGMSSLQSRRNKQESSSISSKDFADKVAEGAKAGTVPTELIQYLQGDNHKYLSSNDFKARERFNELITKLAGDKKESELGQVLETSGFSRYVDLAKKPYIGQMAILAENVIKFLTDKEGRTEAAAKIVGTILTNEDGVKRVDVNHENIGILKSNKTFSALYSAAVSLGLNTEIQSIVSGLKEGVDLSQIALSGEARKAEIEYDMTKLASIVSKETGSIYDGDRVVLSATRISTSEADLINASSNDGPLVKSGEELNFYKWFVKMREDATLTDDRELSRTVNGFIDKYIAVQKLRADQARLSGSDNRATAIEADAQKFMSMLTTGSLGLPKYIRNLVQRGLDYSQGIDSIGNQILVNGSDSETPKQTVKDELTGFEKLVDKRQAIFGVVDHLQAVISGTTGNVTSYAVEKATDGTITFSEQPLTIVTDTDSNKGKPGFGTFSDAALGYRDMQEAIAARTATQFTRSIFNNEDFSKEELEKFHKETLAANTTAKQLELTKDKGVVDYQASSNNRIAKLAEIIGTLGTSTGVAKNLEARELSQIVTDLVNNTLSTAVLAGNTNTPVSEVAKLIEEYNKAESDASKKFNTESLMNAILTRNATNIKTELGKLSNIAQHMTATTTNSKWIFKYDSSKAPSSTIQSGLCDAFSGDKIRSFVGKLIHDKNTPDPLRTVTSEHITSIIEGTDELKDALLQAPGVHSSIENFEALKNSPEIAGPEATILFSEKASLNSKSADARAKFTVLLGLLKRVKDEGSTSDKRFGEILASVSEKFFAAELSKAAEKSPHLSNDEARRERREELVTSLKTFLESTDSFATFNNIVPGSVKESNIEVSQTAIKGIIDGENLAGLDNLRQAGTVNDGDGQALLTIKILTSLASYQKLLSDRITLNKLPDTDPNKVSRLTAKQSEIDTAKAAIDLSSMGDRRATVAIKASSVQADSITSIGDAAALLANAGYRRMTLSMANRAVVASGAEVAAGRIAAKLNSGKRDTNTTLEVMSSVSAVLTSHLTRLGEFQDGNKVMASIKKELNDNPRAKNLISGLANEPIDKLTEDKKYNAKDNIEDLLEKWVALLEALSYGIVPNAYQTSEKEQARVTKGSGASSKSSSVSTTKPAETPAAPKEEKS